ncbi:pentapeptide repeat-containing protein [Streptomyces niveus]|uniref:pentapeptide repeat-containing protein n=1 Tax=Streptomyces niveus TaxID=193462 RepID=UPI0033F7B357
MAPLALLVVGFISLVLYHYAYELLAHTASSQKPRKPVDVNDVIRTTVTVLTLMGAVLAGVYAYRKQLIAEGDAHRADASQLADRYTTSAEQLGHEQAAVRLAGVYALTRLADDWEEQRQVCVDVLCAYLRMPYQPDPAEEGHRTGEGEVRQTIISVISDHLRRPDDATAWSRYSIDFAGGTFDRGDFAQCHFRGPVYFTRATFTGEVFFVGATFSDTVSFAAATFSGLALFNEATFNSDRVFFDNATFTGEVSFDNATFNGTVFDGGRLPPSTGA